MAEEIAKVEKTDMIVTTDENDIFALPAEWGFDSPAILYRTTIDATTDDGKRLLYSALNDDGAGAKESVNKELQVVGVTFVPIEKTLPNGEVIKGVAMKLSCKNGDTVGTNSKWLMVSMRSLIMFKRCVPTPKKPWKLVIVAKDAGKNEYGEQKQVLKIKDLDFARK